MIGVIGGAASGQSSQDHIQGLCLVMEVLQKTPFAGVSKLLSDIYAVSVKSQERGLQQAARKKKGTGLGCCRVCMKIAQPRAGLQSSHNPLHPQPSDFVRLETVPSAAAASC